MAIELLSTTTLAQAGQNVQILNIPQTGTDLYILCSMRGSSNSALFVGVFGVGSTVRTLRGNGSGATSVTSDQFQVAPNQLNTSQANTFSSYSFYIPNYSGTQSKTLSGDAVTHNGASNGAQWLAALSGAQTTAVTSLTFIADNGFSIGSSISLYAIS